MNLKVICLVLGIVVGAIVGYFTRPEAAELKLGPLQVEVQSNRTASPRDRGEMTSSQWQHVGAFTVGGAVLGLLAGFVVDRRR